MRFGDVVRQVKDTVDPETSGLERYVAGEHMGTDDLHIRSWGTIGDGYLGPAFHMRFRPGQVLYGSRRTYLRKVAYAEFEGVCANTTFVVEPKTDELLPELLPFIMQTEAFHEYSLRQSRGSVNPYVNFRDIASYEFALPPKDEQRRIAEILWAADAAAESQRSVAATFDDVRARILDSRIEHLYSIAGSNERETLASILERSPESGHTPKASSSETGYWVLTLTSLGPHGYVPGQIRPAEYSPALERTLLHRGDLLISRSNTVDLVGRVGTFDDITSNVSFTDLMMRLTVRRDIARPRFVELVLRSSRGRAHLRAVAAGTSASMKKINRAGLGAFEMIVPALDVQDALIELSVRLAQQAMLIQSSLRSSAALRIELGARCLSGDPCLTKPTLSKP